MMGKQPGSIVTSTGGDKDGVSDSTDKHCCTWSPNIEEGDDDGSSDFASRLVKAMNTHTSDPKVYEDLSPFVDSAQDVQACWFTELKELWQNAPPKDSLAATKLVYEAFQKVHPGHIDVIDLEGFLHRYKLPHYAQLRGGPPYTDGLMPVMTEAFWKARGM